MPPSHQRAATGSVGRLVPAPPPRRGVAHVRRRCSTRCYTTLGSGQAVAGNVSSCARSCKEVPSRCSASGMASRHQAPTALLVTCTTRALAAGSSEKIQARTSLTTWMYLTGTTRPRPALPLVGVCKARRRALWAGAGSTADLPLFRSERSGSNGVLTPADGTDPVAGWSALYSAVATRAAAWSTLGWLPTGRAMHECRAGTGTGDRRSGSRRTWRPNPRRSGCHRAG